ncbi:MAG: DUF4136 domain-containing protein [Flavobacteriaceae bacterium]|nr:DUF4136 domain-containing protein [Flavobacteriaceae bacterium]
MKYLLLIITTAILISCGATVNYDYDTQKDFSVYKTYDFYPGIESGLSELDNIRVMKATDSVLQLRGFTKSVDPDFLINFFAKEFITQSSTSIGIGVGGGGHNGGVGVSGGVPVGGDEINQTLTIDFIDNKADNLFWQAVGSDELKVKATSVQKDAYYFKLISKIMTGFPPEK